jgi:hypothetical protein
MWNRGEQMMFKVVEILHRNNLGENTEEEARLVERSRRAWMVRDVRRNQQE